MPFGWGRATAAAIDRDSTASAESPPYELAAVEMLTDTGPFTGWIATEGERTSDWVNRQSDLPIYGLAPSDGAVDQAPTLAGTSIETLGRERIIWIVPPPLPPNRHLRLHRRRVRVRLELDAYDIVGQVHVRPGADATDALLRGSRELVPLTEALVTPRGAGGGVEPMVLPVLIVNVQHVRRLVAEGAQRAAPPPDVSAPEPSPTTTGVLDGAATEASLPAADHPDAATALVTLLDAGLIDVVEFQAIRARIVAATPS